MKTAFKRHFELSRQLKKYSKQYYIFEDPTVTDAEYDALEQELLKLEQRYPELKTKDSPSNLVGAEASDNFGKITHKRKMLSLKKAYDKGEIADFFAGSEECEIWVEPKFDGLAVSLVYVDGILISGATRGDGLIGEDVTKNIMTLDCVPEYINLPGEVEVRGEVVMLRKDFECLNRERQKRGEKLMSNPRAAASGSLRQKDYRVTAERKLIFYAYELFGVDDIQTQVAVVNRLKSLGFITADKSRLCRSLYEVAEFCEQIDNDKDDLDYDIDGVVCKVNSLRLQKKLGSTTKYPRYAIAYKFSDPIAQTMVLNIDLKKGKTGKITPIAELEPVNINGQIIRRVPLYSERVKIGDKISVVLAGGIVPRINKSSFI